MPCQKWQAGRPVIFLSLVTPWLLDVQDNSQLGIKAMMGRLSDALQAADQELWLHVNIKNKVSNCKLGSCIAERIC